MRMNVKPAQRITAWVVYLALVAAVYAVHACALERDLKAAPVAAATRHA